MKPKASPTPHSWGINTWPADVYPGQPNRGKYLINTHKADLMASGALVRVGRELVVLGSRYTRWLERQASRVPDFEIAPNQPKPAQPAA